MATGNSYPLINLSLLSTSGYTSINFTIRSRSLAEVLANICAVTSPVTVKFSFRVSPIKLTTSGLVVTKRWSSTCHEYQRLP